MGTVLVFVLCLVFVGASSKEIDCLPVDCSGPQNTEENDCRPTGCPPGLKCCPDCLGYSCMGLNSMCPGWSAAECLPWSPSNADECKTDNDCTTAVDQMCCIVKCTKKCISIWEP